MDPNAVLEEIRTLCDDMREGEDVFGRGRNMAEMSELLAEKVHALDEWLSRGGFLPSAWHATHRVAY